MTHTLTVINAVDVPDELARKVLELLKGYDPDIYTRDCDAKGFTGVSDRDAAGLAPRDSFGYGR